ncbi:3-hydroxyacyl-CoA dehydrogenase NAD-binding domain-containing protein [Achromobacter sp. MFA1 R4]|uniref:3-hydroxyacyl-CoA dehydrogenase NAD-binding domain-containing protein n=1 Tax=Achromobacter sp. MFA1 R4 TaxID=1881016 RepID=UPI000953994B|nr:3-hydroxyacyl-CoA dehydrogenase NAD-binding domain-containing protein [Achromobacter sp. MFA1 R4]SIT17925.1 3-hydroxyacyl-CoA dehydrogenase [Achromobacter sp. MFA1 R4]
MTQFLSYDQTGATAVIRLWSPPVNALSRGVRIVLYDAIMRAAEDPGVRAVVLTGNGRIFSAGADISEFRSGSMFAGRDLTQVIGLLDALDKPIVAAIEGSALGGGLELALGCHARVAAQDATLGLPEIRLGVIPGGTGTQRLPRLVGVDAALRMMIGGEAIDAAQAKAIGLVDAVATGDVVQAALDFAERLAQTGSTRRTSELAVRGADTADLQLDTWHPFIKRVKAPAYAASQILACVHDAIRLPFAEAVRQERQRFEQCNASEAAQGLQHAFVATRAAAKLPASYAGAKIRDISRVAIIGGGTMGRGIAMAVAQGGFDATVIETDPERAAAALDTIRGEYQRQVTSNRIDAQRAQQLSSRIQACAVFEAVRDADLIIEAVYENLDIKREIARRLGQACRPGAIIASNTSTLNIDLLAKESGRASDFLGLHFFSPANVMRLVEVVRGQATDDAVMATAMDFVRRIAKSPVITGVCYGFIGNRMLEPYLREVEALLLQGCTPARIDAALESFGMAMGPCRMMDLAGVDVVAKVVEERGKQSSLPDDPHYRIVCRQLAGLGHFGQKSGQGFYTYDGRRIVDDGAAIGSIAALAARHGIAPRAGIDANEIVERCLFPLINEGFSIVEEGIAYRESDVDVVWLAGYGFPAERGGPLFYARRLGLRVVGQRLRHYAAEFGDAHGYWSLATTIGAVADLDTKEPA